jgi:hypothetical protein
MMENDRSSHSHIKTGSLITILRNIDKMVTILSMHIHNSLSLITYIINKLNNVYLTSFPSKNTVSPLKGWLTIDYESPPISTPHTIIPFELKYSFASFNVEKLRKFIYLLVP